MIKGTNKGTPIHADPCAFPCFGNVGPPIMATLNLHGFTMELLIWLFTNPIVPNALDASQESTLSHVHQTNVNPSHSLAIKSSPPPSSSSSENAATSNQNPTKKKRKNQKKKKHGGKPLASSLEITSLTFVHV